MLRTDYRFTLTRDTETFEVTPGGFFDGSFNYEQEEGQLFFRMKYEGTLNFKGNDYEYIKTRYDLNAYCDLYELLIEKYDGSAYVVFWSGYFSMSDGKFDFEQCQFSVQPTVWDKYSSLLRNWEKKINILDGTPSPLFGDLKTTLELEIVCSDTELATPYYQEMLFIGNILHSGTYYRISCREIAINYRANLDWQPWNGDDDSGANSTILGNINPDSGVKFVRSGSFITWKPTIDQITLTYYSNPDGYEFYGSFTNAANVTVDVGILKTAFSTENYTISILYRGWKFGDVMQKVCQNTCEWNCWVGYSDFFTTTVNPATGEVNELKELYFIQNSDAKKPYATQPATKGELDLKTLLEDLYNMFQVYWYIDSYYGLRFIHPSEFENNLGINITQSPYIRTTAHKKYIDFNKSMIYRYEKWDMANTGIDDFKGVPIEYDELCSGKEDPRTKTFDVSLNTDMGYLDLYPDEVSDSGFMFVATLVAPFPTIQNRTGLLTGRYQVNECLSISRLHNNYWRHNRILRTGLMNNIETMFTSSQKLRKLKEHNIILCEEFDPLKNVVTDLGDAVVNEASYFPIDSKLTLNLSI